MVCGIIISMRSRRRGLAQFFGSDEIKPVRNVDAENLCLTPSVAIRLSKSVNDYNHHIVIKVRSEIVQWNLTIYKKCFKIAHS